MRMGSPVLNLTDTEVRCEGPMSYEEKGHVLFTKFHQRNFSRDVRNIAHFTVIPSGTGSQVQGRQYWEAQINGETRLVERPERDTGWIVSQLRSMGGR